ncbi:CaiD Enoyl-CoA hydratase/carnithine racemase [Flavobacteriaceae bacterium]
MKTLRLTWYTKSYLQVTLDNPPLNLFDQNMIDDFQQLANELDQNDAVKVVVFESADPDFFISHYDILGATEPNAASTKQGYWPDIALQFERAPYITVGKLRGRARAAGSEVLLAMDVRFGSREKTLISQIEVGCGLIPGAGGLERLPKLIGRARAIEAIVGARDFDADTAAAYGWINRSIPDAELDQFVTDFALRVQSFDKKAIALAKSIINERTQTIAPSDLQSTQEKFFEALSWPQTKERLGELIAQGFQQRDFELNLADHLSTY